MPAFKKGDVVKVNTVLPEGPMVKMRMDDDGTIYYLLAGTADGAEDDGWSTEDQLVSVG